MLGVLLLAAALNGADAVCDATFGYTAEQMFEHARDVWSAAKYPKDVYYTVVISAEVKGKPRGVRYAAHADPSADAIAVHRFSEEEARDPYVARGINVAFKIKLQDRTAFAAMLSGDEPTFDLLGIPRLSPFYSFGMRRSALRSAISAAVAPAASDTSGLKTIGGTTTRARDYDVTCGGLEPNTDGSSVLRLTLHPRRDPGRFRLRTIWLDPESFAVERIETQGNFTRDAPVTVPWLTTFVMRDGLPYIASEHAEASLRVDGRLLSNVEIQFLPRDPPPDAASRLLFHLRADADELREPDSDI
jgi:hypothetical protein